MMVLISSLSISAIMGIRQYFHCKNAVKTAYERLDGYRAEEINLSYGKMTYVDRGAGEVILVAHGISGGYDQAYDTVKDKVSEYRILAPSRFGYLGSDMPEKPTPAAQAKAYVEFLDQKGIDKAFILGISAGGTVAIRFALDYPERTKGCILFSSAAPYGKKPKRYIKYQGMPSFLCYDFPVWLISPLFQPVMGMNHDTVYGMLPLKERRSGIIMDSAITNPDMARNFDKYPLEQLSVPTLIIHAKDDAIAGYQSMKKVIGRFPACTFITVSKGGHLMDGQHITVENALDTFINKNK